MNFLDFFKKKITQIPLNEHRQIAPQESFLPIDLTINDVESKSWETLFRHNAFASMYDSFISIEQLRGIYKTEKNVPKVLNRIANQFLGLRFYIESPEESVTYNSNILTELNNLSDNSTVHYECVIDMLLTGNAFLMFLDTTRRWERVKPEYISEKVDGIYVVTDNKGKQLKVVEKDIIHFKMPSIIDNSAFGDSPLAVTILNLLLDRYGYEYINTFFQKGGAGSGIIETDETNQDKLQRLILSLRGAFSSRKNSHADKVLPKGCKWVGFGNTFQNMQLREILKDNLRDFASQFGVPPVLLGDTDGVNFANSNVQMELFFKQTILPFQKMYCDSIMNNARYKKYFTTFELKVDNSGVSYLSDFDAKVGQIPNLKEVLTINEIRKLLGYGEIDEAYFKPEPSLNFFDSTSTEENFDDDLVELEDEPVKYFKAKKKDLSDPEKAFFIKELARIFDVEIQTWVEMYIKNPTLQEAEFYSLIKTERAGYFSASVATLLEKRVIEYYKFLMAGAVKNSKSLSKIRLKDFTTDFNTNLVERARGVLMGKILSNGQQNFYKYSKTATERLYKEVDNIRTNRPNISDAEMATILRQGDSELNILPFAENYKSQLNTIVRTEIGAAIAETTRKAGDDISIYANKATKTWSTKIDAFTREPHEAMNGAVVEWVPKNGFASISEMPFDNGLRYPRDGERGTPADVINCRCTVLYDIIEFKEF